MAAPARWETRVLKQDRRSRVWRVDHPEGVRVIKRFEHHPTRQLLAAGLGLHAGQKEKRANRRMRRSGVAVVPMIASGWTRSGPGVKGWLATPWGGWSLAQVLGAESERASDRGGGQGGPGPTGVPGRADLAKAVARLTGALIARGWFFKDLKTSNILVDEAGRVRLIDVGSVRRRRSRRQTVRMLAMLDHTARQHGATRTDRLRVGREVVACVPELGPLQRVAREVAKREGTGRLSEHPRSSP